MYPKLPDGNSASDYLEQLAAIADLYIQGYALEFEQLFSGEQYSRISLPTYPFARERYWVPEGEKQGKSSVQGHMLHPLLHENTSDLSEQRYSTTFTGGEFFLADHVVKGQPDFTRSSVPGDGPGSGRGGNRGCRSGGVETEGIRLKNVVWLRPLVVGAEPVPVNIGLYPEANGAIAYEIYSGAGTEQIYSQGSAELGTLGEAENLDLEAIQKRCQTRLEAGEIYERFKGVGLEYGPGHQGIEELYAGMGEVLAKLRSRRVSPQPGNSSCSIRALWTGLCKPRSD